LLHRIELPDPTATTHERGQAVNRPLATVFEGMRNQMSDELTAQNLAELSAELLGKARGARSGRAARGVFSGTYLRQVLLTLTEGAERSEEHTSELQSRFDL